MQLPDVPRAVEAAEYEPSEWTDAAGIEFEVETVAAQRRRTEWERYFSEIHHAVLVADLTENEEALFLALSSLTRCGIELCEHMEETCRSFQYIHQRTLYNSLAGELRARIARAHGIEGRLPDALSEQFSNFVFPFPDSIEAIKNALSLPDALLAEIFSGAAAENEAAA